MSLGRLLARVGAGLVVVWLATSGVFLAVRLVPGDAVDALGANRRLDPATRSALVERYGLDRSLAGQYATFASSLLRGDLGESIRLRRPVAEVIGRALPVTAKLAGLAVVFELAIALPVAAAVARRPGGAGDRLALAGAVVAVATPVVVVASLAQNLLAARAGLFPTTATGSTWSLVLPAATLAITGAAVTMRVTRARLVAAMAAPWVVAARARGVAEWRVTLRHGLRTALGPTIAVVGVNLGFLVGGAAVVEQVYNIRGLGFEITQAVRGNDWSVITGATVVLVTVFVVLSVLVDLAQAAADPRLRRG